MAAQSRKRSVLGRCALAIALVAFGARLGALHWAGDLLSLVADTILWAALLLLALCLWLRDWRPATLAGLALLLSGSQLMSPLPATRTAEAGAGRSLRLLVYNVYYQNRTLDAVVAEVRRHDPDIVFLMEYSYDVQRQIEASFTDYPYRLIEPSRLTMGIALFSRIPVDSAEVYRAEATRIPVLLARLRAGGSPFTLVGGHPWPPQPQWGQLHRDQMLEIIRVAESAAGPLIVAGDFNAAPWSHTMRLLGERAAVRQVRQPLDLTKTWHLLPPVGLPLDHVLVSDEWGLLSYQYGVPAGSDHVPLIVELRLPEP